MSIESSRLTDAFLNLVSSSLEGVPAEVSLHGTEEWEELFKFCCRHNLASQLSPALENCAPVPDMTRIKFATMQLKAVEHHSKVRSAAAELAAAYQKNGLETIILKGLTLSGLYPHPEFRTFSDLDIVVTRGDGLFASEEADRIAAAMGARFSDPCFHHDSFTYKGVYVENHFDLTSRAIRRSGENYERILRKVLWKGLEKFEIDGQEVLRGSADFEALFLMRHCAVHFEKDCISLRQILDWMQFLRVRGKLVDWDYVCRVFRQFGMEPFVGVVMVILRDKFGYDCPLEFISDFADGVDAGTAGRVWEEILFAYTRMPDGKSSSTLCRLMNGFVRTYRNRWKHRLCTSDPLWIDNLHYIKAVIGRETS